jgi:gliding motility-associated-like protein
MKSNIILLVIIFLLHISFAEAQLSAPGSSATTNTEYISFPETDNIFIFCAGQDNGLVAALEVETTLAGTKSYDWEKYNVATRAFEPFYSDLSESQTSVISSLEDGGYRVSVTAEDTTMVYRAWVFNSRLSATAGVSESTCTFFTLSGNVDAPRLVYYDPSVHTELEVDRQTETEWMEGQAVIAGSLETQVLSPPTVDTEYTFRVHDRFGCESSVPVFYESVVTRAAFSMDTREGEAPLTVTFNNESENGDPGLYEWFFYRNFDDIKKESETTQGSIDSIMVVAYDQNPVFTFERSGDYKVKLVSKKVTSFDSLFLTCVDTAYMENFIIVDTSFVDVPNVITPNGDGINDHFVVRFWSMQSIRISIFNRWGKRIHFWESSDVRGFENTYTETVWDGKIGNRYASPGVYFYVVDGRGRDDKKRKAHGFFHLFRDRE